MQGIEWLVIVRSGLLRLRSQPSYNAPLSARSPMPFSIRLCGCLHDFFRIAPYSAWLGIVLVVGCVSSGNPSVVDQDRIAQIKLNTSTKEDVKRILGPPNTISRHSGSYSVYPGLPPSSTLTNVEVWSYTHINVDVDAATFIPIVGLFAGGATSNINTFTAVFDEQGIIRHISASQSQGRSGLGAREKWQPID